MSGLRSKKSARLKFLLGSTLGEELKTKKFNEIKVTDLCKVVDISKVTFFKYFFCKEELLRYYFRIWCLEIGVELHHNPKNGIEGIHFIFAKVFESLKKRPTFLPELISYQMADDKIRAPFPLNQLERELFHPKESELGKVEIKSLEQHIDSFALEAILNNEISSSSPERVTAQLYRFLLGNIVQGSMYKKRPTNVEIRQNVESFLDSYR